MQNENQTERHDKAVALASTASVETFLRTKGAPAPLVAIVEEVAAGMAEDYGIESVTGDGPETGTVSVNYADGSTETVTVAEIRAGGAQFIETFVRPLLLSVLSGPQEGSGTLN